MTRFPLPLNFTPWHRHPAWLLTLLRQSGDIITVCDCGGGTSVSGPLYTHRTEHVDDPTHNRVRSGQDAVSYLIASTQPFRLEDCVPAKARFCGPVLLDSSFRELLDQKVKAVAAPNPLPQGMIRDLYLSLWESNIKRTFNGSAKEWLGGIAVPRGGQRANLRTFYREVAFTGYRLAQSSSSPCHACADQPVATSCGSSLTRRSVRSRICFALRSWTSFRTATSCPRYVC